MPAGSALPKMEMMKQTLALEDLSEANLAAQPSVEDAATPGGEKKRRKRGPNASLPLAIVKLTNQCGVHLANLKIKKEQLANEVAEVRTKDTLKPKRKRFLIGVHHSCCFLLRFVHAMLTPCFAYFLSVVQPRVNGKQKTCLGRLQFFGVHPGDKIYRCVILSRRC